MQASYLGLSLVYKMPCLLETRQYHGEDGQPITPPKYYSSGAPKGSARTGETFNGNQNLFGRLWESYPGQGEVSVILSLRAVRTEREEERKKRRDTFTG